MEVYVIAIDFLTFTINLLNAMGCVHIEIIDDPLSIIFFSNLLVLQQKCLKFNNKHAFHFLENKNRCEPANFVSLKKFD